MDGTPHPAYIADPRRGSPRSRDIAVDLTLLDAAGRPLEMGGAVDACTPRGHHGAEGVSPAAMHNRLPLLGIMTMAGWDWYANEWWHDQFFNPRDYAPLADSAAGAGMT